MNEINFSHSYVKLHNQKQAKLIAVFVIDDGEINEELKNYDTSWVEGSKNGFYTLSSGKLLQLIFYGELKIPFCTIRSYSPEKEKFYHSQIGEEFKITIGGLE